MPERFHFVVNDVPVRLWGANWVTPHWETAVWDEDRVRDLEAMAENADFNALRVWGEVESPRDSFYEWADTKGILLWQDFPQLPLAADDLRRAACREESAHFVMRLMHHPSVLLWNANNEGSVWYHPEFSGSFEDHGSWPGLVAAADVGEVMAQLDPERVYVPTSPYFGPEPNDPRGGTTRGLTHTWYVPGYDYLNFADEDTRMGAPVLQSLKRFMRTEDIWPDNYSALFKAGDLYPFPATWLPYTGRESWKKFGPIEQFYDATDAASSIGSEWDRPCTIRTRLSASGVAGTPGTLRYEAGLAATWCGNSTSHGRIFSAPRSIIFWSRCTPITQFVALSLRC